MALRAHVVLVALVTLMVVAVAPAVWAGPNKIAPPNSNAYGQSLTEWMSAYWQAAIAGDDLSWGKVVGLPLPNGAYAGGAGTPEDPEIYVGVESVEMRPGTPFVLPIVAWTYEIYEDGSIDPEIPFETFQSWMYPAFLTLDGKPIIEDFYSHYIGPDWWDEPVWYAAPTSYGSVGAVGVQGVGFVAAPLTPGEHVLTLESGFMFPGPPYGPYGIKWQNTWYITVVPPGKG